MKLILMGVRLEDWLVRHAEDDLPAPLERWVELAAADRQAGSASPTAAPGSTKTPTWKPGSESSSSAGAQDQAIAAAGGIRRKMDR